MPDAVWGWQVTDYINTTSDELREIIKRLDAEWTMLHKKARRARSRDRQCQIYAEMRVIRDRIEEFRNELESRNPASKPVMMWRPSNLAKSNGGGK